MDMRFVAYRPLPARAGVHRVGHETTTSREDHMAAQPSQMKAHVSTYDRVIAMMKWGAVAVAIIAFFFIWLIA